ncbi:BPTI/Kunitz domain-containing protein-like [Pituophis catenifer annectens]|uniref:BPTI/Kunitz domain-containing protein-like n=1 Tax=Pituophis catenifer annectens TaxID=94852 RepID=UPI003994A4F3
MWAKLLLVGVLLSFSADLHAADHGDGDEESLKLRNSFCQLPPDRQKCSDESSLRVFYNSQAGVCEKFVHQGCKGNGNNFATQLECLQACASRDICQLPSDSGFGDAFRSRFFYNTVSKACESFLYKGSRGNANNFWDEETCTQFCTGPRRRCPTPHGFGICISQCESDADCGGGLLCCPTGCGTACQRGVLEVGLPFQE